MNVDPAPSTLRTSTSPPISSVNARRDRQPKPGPAIAPRRGAVGLDEALEQVRQLLGRHADPAIDDGELDPVLPAAVDMVDAKGDDAVGGEFGGIAGAG